MGRLPSGYLFIFVSALVLAGCVNRSTATLTPGGGLNNAKAFYVVTLPADERGIDQLIGQRLNEMGYTATVGPNEAVPDNTEIVVTYADKWMWDITMYMLELTITFRDAESAYPILVGNSYHTSLTRLSPQEMVNEVLTKMFDEVKS